MWLYIDESTSLWATFQPDFLDIFVRPYGPGELNILVRTCAA